MIERLLPLGVAWAESFADEDCTLFPEEALVVARAVEKRRREFVSARCCARRALAALGMPPVPIIPDSLGAPGWPPGVVGSITHCAGYQAAVAARSCAVVTVGADAEPHAPLPEGALEAISLPDERAWIGRYAVADPDVCWDRLLFSAKESVYKAWYPLTERWLGFEEARLTARRTGADGGVFHAELRVAGAVLPGGRPLTAFTGRWLVADALVLTAVALPGP